MRYSVAIANGLINKHSDIKWIKNNHTTFSPDLRSQVLSDYTFILLRCPFSRLASAFLDKIVKWPHLYFNGKQKRGYIKSKLDNLSLSLVTFEKFVLKLYKNDNFLRSNAHWRPQIDFLLFNDYDDYFCVEEMEVVVKTLKHKINFEVVDARHITKHGIDQHQRIRTENGFLLTTFEILEQKTRNMVVQPKSLFSARLVELISEIYADDIQLYLDNFGKTNLLFST